jgi:hypothetical protein
MALDFLDELLDFVDDVFDAGDVFLDLAAAAHGYTGDWFRRYEIL